MKEGRQTGNQQCRQYDAAILLLPSFGSSLLILCDIYNTINIQLPSLPLPIITLQFVVHFTKTMTVDLGSNSNSKRELDRYRYREGSKRLFNRDNRLKQAPFSLNTLSLSLSLQHFSPNFLLPSSSPKNLLIMSNLNQQLFYLQHQFLLLLLSGY